MPTKYEEHSRTLLMTVQPVPPIPLAQPVPSNSRFALVVRLVALDPEGHCRCLVEN